MTTKSKCIEPSSISPASSSPSDTYETASREIAAKSREECVTPEELFWHVLKKVADKAKDKGLMLSVVAKPGWSYHAPVAVLRNLTQAEVEKADRVIWQRTPRVKRQ
jgi:hypothetical protein